MLVLSRKHGESILIGENIYLTVVRIGPNNVRLGIEAPRDVNIVRTELNRQDAEDAKQEKLGALGGLAVPTGKELPMTLDAHP